MNLASLLGEADKCCGKRGRGPVALARENLDRSPLVGRRARALEQSPSLETRIGTNRMAAMSLQNSRDGPGPHNKKGKVQHFLFDVCSLISRRGNSPKGTASEDSFLASSIPAAALLDFSPSAKIRFWQRSMPARL